MNRCHTLTSCLVFLLVVNAAYAQDIHFSQFWANPVFINPAMAGVNKQLNSGVVYRNQWKSIGTPYSTFSAEADVPITSQTANSGFVSAGLIVFNDKAGESELGQFQSSLSLAYHVKLNDKSTLGAGISAGFAQRTINYSNLKWGSQFDGYNYNPALPSGQNQGVDKTGFFDLGSGLVYSYSKGEKYMTGNDQLKVRAGISLFHVNRPDCSFNGIPDRLKMKSVVFGDLLIGVPNTNLSIVPRIYYCRQGVLGELLLGSSFMYVLEQKSNYTGFQKGKAVSAGLYLRTNDAVIATVQLDLSSFLVGISYDFNTSDLKNATGGRGGMEFTLGYTFDTKSKRSS